MNSFINLEYLNTFVTAAETGRLNVTAQLVFRSQAAVSTQIKKLEEQLGTELFIRGKNSLTLTRDGEILMKYAEEILGLNDAAVSTIKNKNWTGNVIFGIPTDYTAMFLACIHPKLKDGFPSFHFSVDCSRSRIIRRSIERGSVSAAIIAMEPQFQDDIPLWEEPLYWACAKGFPFQKNKPLPVALFSDDCIVNTYTMYALKHFYVDYEIVFRSIMTENIVEAVRKGVAVSLLTASSITEDLEVLPESILPGSKMKLKVGFRCGKGIDEETSAAMYEILKAGVAAGKKAGFLSGADLIENKE